MKKRNTKIRKKTINHKLNFKICRILKYCQLKSVKETSKWLLQGMIRI